MVKCSLLALALFGAGFGCASPRSSAAPPGATSSQPASAASPASDAPDCPHGEATVTAIGTPCAHEGQVCGARAAAKATGFSNLLHCRGGRWENVEVPPPPPPQ